MGNEEKRDLESEIPSPKKTKYLQKYNAAWEQIGEYGFWLSRGKSEEFAYCSVCKRELLISNSGKTGVEKHAQGKKHQQRIANISEQSALLGFSLNNMKCESPDSDDCASENSQKYVTYTDNNTPNHADDACDEESNSSKTSTNHKPYTVTCQAEEPEPEGSKSTAEALDKVANALQQIAAAIERFSNWIPDQDL